MNLLLDSHTFIWWHDDPAKLSRTAFDQISEPENYVSLSIASIWEIQIKIALGKFTLVDSLEKSVETEKNANQLRILPIDLGHILALGKLPHHHKDPFDRLLIAQASTENMTLVSGDKQFSRYDVDVVW